MIMSTRIPKIIIQAVIAVTFVDRELPACVGG